MELKNLVVPCFPDRSSLGCSMHCLLVLCHRIFCLHALPDDALIRALPKYAQSQFRLQQMSVVSQSYRDQSLKSKQGTLPSLDKFSLLGLLGVIRNHDPDLASLSLGIDLTTLGLNLNSPDNLHKTFGSPWSDEPVKGDPEHVVPECYYTKPPPQLHQGYFAKFQLAALFYIFYRMPKDEAQLYAAIELENGIDDVTIKILYCGMCHTDLHHIKNDWGITMYPLVPGATSRSVQTMIIGRVLCGIGRGISSAIVPLYISEISPTEIHGALGSVNQLFICIDIPWGN